MKQTEKQENRSGESGAGIAFTRDPVTGNKVLTGEFLIDAQVEDVIVGVRIPRPIREMEARFPEAFRQLQQECGVLENRYRDMQCLEFTVKDDRLYLLGIEPGKRTPLAAVRIACGLVDEGLTTEQKALDLIDLSRLDTLLRPQIDPDVRKTAVPVGRGLGASPGFACGRIVFTSEDAVDRHQRGEPVILVGMDLSLEDIPGIRASQGVLNVRGGMTCHAAIIAGGLDICCIAGCYEIKADEKDKSFTLGGKTFRQGDFLSLDGSDGCIYDGIIPTIQVPVTDDYNRIMAWVNRYRK